MPGTLTEMCSYLCQHDFIGCSRELLPGKHKSTKTLLLASGNSYRSVYETTACSPGQTIYLSNINLLCAVSTIPKLLHHELCPILINFSAVKDPP